MSRGDKRYFPAGVCSESLTRTDPDNRTRLVPSCLDSERV